MDVLITGGHGFLGRHVVARVGADAPDVRVHAPDRRACELTADGLPALLRAVRPAWILHLAGRLTGAEHELRRDNEAAAGRLFEAARACRPLPRIVLASSAAVYGRAGSREQPVDECLAPAPRGLYAETKFAAEGHAARYAAAGGEVVVARLSNPVGPGMGDHLLCGTIARQLVAIERGRQAPVLELRDLSPVRDFLHVADAAEAVRHLARHGTKGETYNVGSGRSVAVRDVVDLFLKLARVSPIEVRSTRTDAARSPLQEQWLDVGKLRATGWAPAGDFERAAADLLDAVRAVQEGENADTARSAGRGAG